MVLIESKRTIQSTAMPGISFTVRRLSHIARAARDLSTIDARAKMTKLLREWNELDDKAKKGAALTEAETDRQSIIDHEFSLLMAQRIKPAAILAALKSISGLASQDGPITTAEALLDASCPEMDGLMEEIYQACCDASGLDAAQIKNLRSPTTSREPATGTDTPTA